jgi:predicted metal-dependent phosphoesterase TrpH
VADLAHRAGGIVSAAHLRDRATRATLAMLKEQGLDAVEVRHPAHSEDMRRRIGEMANELGLGCTGGSDWHGDDDPESTHAMIGSQQVPASWLDALGPAPGN